MKVLLPAFLFAVMLIAYLLGQPAWRRMKRRRIAEAGLSDAERKRLTGLVPLALGMPQEQRAEWERAIAIFLAEKRFSGSHGLRVTGAMRLLIAAHACLLVLGRRAGIFDSVRWIQIFPDAFVVEQQSVDETGVEVQEEAVLAGEAWESGRVLLSWSDIERDIAENRGQNVILHEFAHQLDQEQGYYNGAPLLSDPAAYRRWKEVLGREFAALNRNSARHGGGLLDPYGATDPGEFFAVVSEAFFGIPRQMRQLHPELYKELSACFCVDPVAWCNASSEARLSADVERQAIP